MFAKSTRNCDTLPNTHYETKKSLLGNSLPLLLSDVGLFVNNVTETVNKIILRTDIESEVEVELLVQSKTETELKLKLLHRK